MNEKTSLRKEEELLEKRKDTIRRVMEDRTAKDVEYGYFRGCLRGALGIKDRTEQVDKPLSCDCRLCPAYGPVRYAFTIPGCLPLVHGPEGCAFWHKSFFAGAGAYLLMPYWPIITTAMTQEDVFFGGEEALRKAILNADKIYNPDILAVISTCAASIIGDDIEGICQSLKEEVNCYVVPVKLPGFSSRNQILGQDQFLTAIAEHILEESEEKDPLSINYIGETYGSLRMDVPFYTDTEEIERVLHEMGVTINCYLPGDGLENIKKIPRSQLNVLRCMGSGLGFARYAQERFGTDYMATCTPFGIQPTTEFYLGVVEGLGLGKEAERILQREIRETEEALRPYREVLKGKRFALAAAAGRTTSLALLFMELGMEPVYIGFHFIREKTFPNMETVAQAARERGFEPEIVVEPALYEEEAIIDFYRPDIFFCDIHERAMSMHFGIPVLQIMGLGPSGPWQGYKGVLTMAQLTVGALKNPMFPMKGPKTIPKLFSSQRFLDKERAMRSMKTR